MKSPHPTGSDAPHARLDRLEQLLEHDPANELLLADAAEFALASGALDRAEHWIMQALQLAEGGPAWQFRLATLRIAQRRLREAREVLVVLEREGGAHPAITHNLAYCELLDRNFTRCAEMLEPLLDDDAAAGSQAPMVQALWLRALSHLGELDVAWAWVQRRIEAGTLGPAVGGVASLVALDLGRMGDAARLSQQALDGGVVQIEPILVRASLELAERNAAGARKFLDAALKLNPNDGRTWSSLGFAELLDQKYGAAREAFEKALRMFPTHIESMQGLGWSCVLQHELAAAATAFDKAIELDATNADSQGGRAVVHALQGAKRLAQDTAERALALDSANLSARFAQGLVAGETAGPEALKILASGLIRK